MLLALTGFTPIVTETMPTGLLPQISADLGTTPPTVGQMVTIYAVGSLLAAIPIVRLTQRQRRKPMLMIAITGFLVFNLVTAVTASYPPACVGQPRAVCARDDYARSCPAEPAILWPAVVA